MDTDGHNSQILDVFYPHAIDGIEPMEIAAGNDPADYLARYPGIAIQGGIDKRELRFDNPRARRRSSAASASRGSTAATSPAWTTACRRTCPCGRTCTWSNCIKGLANGEDLDTYEPPCELEKQLGPIEEMFDPIKTLADHDEEEAPLPPELLAAMRTK